MDYTARISEQLELIDVTYGDNVAAAAETNSGAVSLANYSRVMIVIHPVDVNDALDVDIEQAQTSSGALTSFDSGSKDITVATTDTEPSIIEIRPEEFTAGYSYINVEVTAANTGGSGNEFVIAIWGIPVYGPAATTNLDSVTD
jgi:hypothetical protein